MVPVSTRNGATWPIRCRPCSIDDIDGSAAEGSVHFALDGTEYEIDLNTEHAQQLRDALAAYLKAGRRVSGGSRQPARGGRRGPASGLNTTEVREWAKAQGIDVKDRGRVPAELVVKFKAATTASKVRSTPAVRPLVSIGILRTCRIAGVASSYAYAPDCMPLTAAAIVTFSIAIGIGRAYRNLAQAVGGHRAKAVRSVLRVVRPLKC
jgi:hypothetical protein